MHSLVKRHRKKDDGKDDDELDDYFGHLYYYTMEIGGTVIVFGDISGIISGISVRIESDKAWECEIRNS